MASVACEVNVRASPNQDAKLPHLDLLSQHINGYSRCCPFPRPSSLKYLYFVPSRDVEPRPFVDMSVSTYLARLAAYLPCCRHYSVIGKHGLGRNVDPRGAGFQGPQLEKSADGEKSAEFGDQDGGRLGPIQVGGRGPSDLELAKYSMHIGDYHRNKWPWLPCTPCVWSMGSKLGWGFRRWRTVQRRWRGLDSTASCKNRTNANKATLEMHVGRTR